MLPADVLRQRLEALAISDGSRMVVYFAQRKYPVETTPAAR
jgi:hypothetical protein